MSLPTPKGRFPAILYKPLLDPVYPPHVDVQDPGDFYAGRAPPVELALVVIEQDQHVDHPLRTMRSLARDRFQDRTILRPQLYWVPFHASLHEFVDQRTNRDISGVT